MFGNTGYEYHWTDRLRLYGEPAPFAEQPNWFESVLINLGIPEILMILFAGIVVYFALEALGQRIIGKMAVVVAVFSATATLCVNVASIFG